MSVGVREIVEKILASDELADYIAGLVPKIQAAAGNAKGKIYPG